VLADKYGRINAFALGGIDHRHDHLLYEQCQKQYRFDRLLGLFWFYLGLNHSGAAAAFSTCVEHARNIGTVMGMGMVLADLGGLVGPPVNGAVVNTPDGFFRVSIFSGAMCIFGGFIALLAKLSTSQDFLAQGLLGRV
jgi:hypothetical protein